MCDHYIIGTKCHRLSRKASPEKMRFNLSLEVWVDLNRWKVGIKENISERSKLDKNRRPKEQRVDEKCEFTENTHLSRFQFEGASTRHPPPLSPISLLVCVCVYLVTSVVSNSLQPYAWYPIRLPCPWDSPGKNTEMHCYALLQGILQEDLLPPGKPLPSFYTNWTVAFIFIIAPGIL